MKFKLLIPIIMILLIVPMVSALDFDNFKEYSDDDRKVTITNRFGFGDKIAEIELITPRVNNVIPGKDRRVMIWEVENFGDLYLNALKEVDILNMKTDRLEAKNFHYEIAIYEDVVIQDYKETCGEDTLYVNGSINKGDCTKSISGTHIENKIVRWERYNTQDLPTGNLTIALVTDVNFGDHYDGIPTIFGEKLTRWAEWTESLNQDLLLYFALDENTGTNVQENVSGVFDGTTFGMDDADWVTGKINNAAQFRNTGETIRLSTADAFKGIQNFTIQTWVNPESGGDGNQRFNQNIFTSGSGDWFSMTAFTSAASGISFDINIGGTSIGINSGTTLTKGVWAHLVVQYNGTAITLYENGVLVDSGVGAWNNAAFVTTRPIFFGGKLDGTEDYSGKLDEIAFWNRTLSAAEVTQLYNAGAGITFTTNFPSIPIVTLTTPIDGSSQSSTNVTFTASFSTSQIATIDNSTLFVYYPNGSLVGTNFSTVDSSLNSSTRSMSPLNRIGDYLWNYEACATNITGSFCNVSISNFTLTMGSTINANTFNASTFETALESFTLNITSLAGTVSSAIFHFNTTTTSGSIITSGSDTIVTATLDIPTASKPTTHNIFWELFYSIGDSENTSIETVFANSTNFTLQEGSPPFDISFLNISFRNETISQERVGATLDGTFIFWLGSGKVNKTLTFTDATENPSYVFAGFPSNRTLNIIESVAYNNQESQQRNFQLTTQMSNVTLNQELFLLPTSDGLFSPFRVEDTLGNVLSSVQATITRVLGGSTITVISGLTDGSGFITFFLDPDITYTGTFTSSGFLDNIFTFVPTADTRTVVMGSTTTTPLNGSTISLNTTYIITPTNGSLNNNTDVDFGFVVSSSQTITLISMNITNSSGFQLGFQSNAGTGTLSQTINTNNLSQILGQFIISGTDLETITVTKVWIIGTEFVGDYSLFNQSRFYLDYGFSDFWKLLIVLSIIMGILIFMSAGEITDTSESKVIVTILLVWVFSIVGWLENPVSTSTSSLAIFGKQYGIAILTSAGGAFFILRRIFIRKI